MLTSAILHPAALSRERFQDARYRQNIEAFARGLWSNAVLLVDPAGRLLDEVINRAEGLGRLGQKTQLIITEIGKNARTRVVRCGSTDSSSTTDAMVRDVAAVAHADAVLVDGGNPLLGLPASTELIEIPTYLDSRFEDKRRGYVENLDSLDEMTGAECDELFTRCVRFSRWLRIYDKFIGVAPDPWKFRDGIEYILNLWSRSALFRPERVEIYTFGQKTDLSWREPIFRKQILDPLNAKFPWPKCLIIKDAVRHQFHARYLETEVIVVKVDKGFDLFGSNQTLLRNSVNVEEASRQHVARWRGLRNAGIVE